MEAFVKFPVTAEEGMKHVRRLRLKGGLPCWVQKRDDDQSVLKVELKRINSTEDHFLFPRLLQDFADPTFFMVCCEEGGGRQSLKHGKAVIVCGMKGKKLRAMSKPRINFLGQHALFAVPNQCLTLTTYQPKKVVTVDQHQIAQEDNLVIITHTHLCHVPASVASAQNPHLAAAVRALMEKIDCLNCNEAHFAEIVERAKDTRHTVLTGSSNRHSRSPKPLYESDLALY